MRFLRTEVIVIGDIVEFGHALSPSLVPLVDICFYGQFEDDSWFRHDKLYPFNTSVEQIKRDCDRLIEIEYSKLNEQEIDKSNVKKLKYLSWGVDSKVFVLDGATGGTSHIGNVGFIDFDEGVDLEGVMRRIAFLQRDGLIKYNPDIISSGRGFHVYLYELFDFDEIYSILTKEYIYYTICDKFFRTTMFLKSSVLRLSDYKKGKIQPLEIVEYGYSYNYIGGLYLDFVRRCIDEVV